MHSHLDSTVAQSPSIPLPRVERRVIWANVAGLESALPLLATPFLLGRCCQVAGI